MSGPVLPAAAGAVTELSQRRPVILDVDTGFDDALALLLALRAPNLNVRAITCVAGNHRLPQVVANTLKVLDVVGAGAIPVAAGMARALLEPLRPPMALHGTDGMADLGLPASARTLAPVHAVELMRMVLEAAQEPVTLIALAPLTNVAVCLRMYPHLASKLHAIVVMGGTLTVPGNTSASAEFNIRCDPEAAAIVLAADAALRLYTLDVFMQVSIARADIEAFCASADPAAVMAGNIMRFACEFFQTDRALIGDAGTVATIIDPRLAQWRAYPIRVELAGQWTRGQTVIDRRSPDDVTRLQDWSPLHEQQVREQQVREQQVEVTETVDVPGIRTLFARSLGVTLKPA